MANLISAQTGNFTSSSTWHTVDSISELDANDANCLNVGTGNSDSATWSYSSSPPTVDGVALKLFARAASPSGTFTVTLRNSTGSSNVTACTVNVSDLPATGQSWIFFKFTSTNGTTFDDTGVSTTLATSTNYIIRVTSSAGSQISLRGGGATIFSRKLRTTTTQAPAANNQLVICNQFTGAGASTAVTVTMDNTAATTWGPSTVGLQGVVVCGNGTLTFGTSSSTAYVFQWRGIWQTIGGGTVNIGTSGTRIPASSSVTLTADCLANADTTLQPDHGGSFNIYGASKIPWTRLTADASVSATTLTVGDTTGWQNSDLLVMTPTDTTTTHDEHITISSVGSSTSVTLNSGLVNAHTGTGLPTNYQGYVMNMTRNVKIAGTSSSLRGQIVLFNSPTVHIEYLEIDWTKWGTNGTNTMAVDIQNTGGTSYFYGVSFNPSTLDTSNGAAFYVPNPSLAFTIDSCVFYRGGGNGFAMRLDGSTSDTTWSVKNNVACRLSNSPAFQLATTKGTITGNTVIACGGNGFVIDEGGAVYDLTPSTFANNEAMLCTSGAGFVFGTGNNDAGGSVSGTNIRAYRNRQGISNSGWLRKLTLDASDFCGNGNGQGTAGAGIRGTGLSRVILTGCTFSGDTTLSSPIGICSDSGVTSGFSTSITIFAYNTTFGVATGIRNAHTTADIDNVDPGQNNIQVYANKCNFASSTVFANLTNVSQQIDGDHVDMCGSFLRAQDWGQSAGDHRTFAPQGNIKLDTVIYHSASPSQRLTPNSATYKLRSGASVTSIISGGTRTVSVWIRRSISTDASGFNYAGNAPRLIVRRNDSIGITADTVLATSSGSNGAWEQLSGTTSAASEDGAIELYVDCDGTSGAWLNVDDWLVS